MNLATHYLEEALRQIKGHKRLADGALQQVTDEEFFRELDPESNRIAILVKHMVQARPANSRVSVDTLTVSPFLMKRGTRISMPVSSLAGLVTLPLAVSPRAPGSV